MGGGGTLMLLELQVLGLFYYVGSVIIELSFVLNNFFHALRHPRLSVKLKSLCITRELIVGSLLRTRYGLSSLLNSPYESRVCDNIVVIFCFPSLVFYDSRCMMLPHM